MATPDLTSDFFWKSVNSAVLANPLDSTAVEEAARIRRWIPGQPSLASHVLFRTSGSSGRAKWVALSKRALLASARAVNDYLKITAADRWLQSLPLFHVGGMGIAARARVAGCAVAAGPERWHAGECREILNSAGVTMVSLVPAQLADFVRLGAPPPGCLRAAIIGGGRLDDALYQSATDLGWPLRESYGMTETASQIATAAPGRRKLEILPGWEVAAAADGLLRVRGPSLLTGYVGCGPDGCFFEDLKSDAWFATNDRGAVSDGCLSVTGRADRCVKVLGELVDLGEVELGLLRTLETMQKPRQDLAVVAVAPAEGASHRERRRGALLVLCADENKNLGEALERYNADCHPLHRVNRLVVLDGLPRTGIGKIAYPELERLLDNEK